MGVKMEGTEGVGDMIGRVPRLGEGEMSKRQQKEARKGIAVKEGVRLVRLNCKRTAPSLPLLFLVPESC